MDTGIMAMMIGISTLLGALGLVALLWGLKTGQFDDPKTFIDPRFDGNDALQDAVMMEEKKEKALKRKKEKNYGPPD